MTATQAAFFDDLIRGETRLYNVLGERLRQDHGIATAQFELLRYIRDHEEVRVSDIAARFAAGVGATSKGVDRMESQGWIVRRPHPANRRSSLLELTPSGRRLVDAAETTFDNELSLRLTRNLSASQLAAAGKVLAALRAGLEDDGVGMPAG